MTAASVGAKAGDFGALRMKLVAVAGALAALMAGAAAFLVASAGPAEALPSYARQTGQPCATCHTAFPELTPYGRRFKIGGYTAGGGDWKGVPIAGMYMPSFTHTQSPQDSPPAPGLHTNDNLVSQQISGFVAGQLYGNLGSFIQVTGDPTVANNVFLDASDVRYADTFKLFGQDTIWGLDANNTPTVEDPWNTTPSFGWPQISSTIAPAFAPPLTHLESGYGQIVGGAGAYVFWNDMLYADFTAYKGLPVSVLQALNDGNSTTDDVNWAPYWRVAIEPHWGDLFWEVGTFGMYGRVTPGRVYGFGTDNFLDVGFDSQIQYAGDQYSLTVKLTDIMEWQRLNSSFAQGLSSNLSDTLNSFKANATFVWDHTYSVGFGYFNINGSSDCNMYGSPAAPCMPDGLGAFPNSYNASPLGDGLILDLAYIPFSYGAPFPYSTTNVRLGIQFTEYLHLYGGTNNFDGSYLGGTHNAAGNNSVFAYAWIAF
jgi:hypothetical protein